ncbi:MAG: carboxymuconolactone decarboxylase family protein [Bacteroidota bacterium]|nr:carboxymuconolactone decarboxylase family protein [Bacteroidota bacterium]
MKKKNILVIPLIIACVLTISSTQVMAQEKGSTLNDLYEFMEKYEKKCPDVAKSFYNLHDTIVIKEGKLSIKEKEFIALGIAIATRCEYCIYFHTAAAMESGATEEEILEAASVAVYMGGGPAFSYIKHVIDALEELKAIKESEKIEN